jgi:CheY-like chemotaxis protein
MKTFRLLVVEHSDVDAELIETALSEIRIPAIHAARAFSLQEARQRFVHKPFDAVLLDLDLPDSIGAATLHRILPVCGDAPVVIFSEDEPGFSSRWIAEGAQDVLQKAELEPGLLLRTLQHSIARHRIVKDLQRTAFVDPATGLLTRLGFFQLGNAATRYATSAWSVARLKLSGSSRVAEL